MIFRLYCSVLLWSMVLPGFFTEAQTAVSQQVSLLTNEVNGWALNREIIISPYNSPVEYIYDPTGCVPQEVLTFNKNGTYKRSFNGKNCTGASVPETRGTWKYLADDKVREDCMLVIRLDDEVNDLYDQDLMVASLMIDYDGVLMFVPDPDDSPTYSQKMLVYLPNDRGTGNSSITTSSGSGSASTKVVVSQSNTPKNTTSKERTLTDYLEMLKQEDIPMSRTFDDTFVTNDVDQEVGVLYYEDDLTGTGPYSLVRYATDAGGTLIADIRSDYSGSSISIYKLTGNTLTDATAEVIDPDLESFLMSEGFAWWNDRYFDGEISDEESEKTLIYSLPVSNFLTENPYIFVEMMVTWEEGGVIDDARILGQLNFNGNEFEFSWSED